jgi:hypothetical protein
VWLHINYTDIQNANLSLLSQVPTVAAWLQEPPANSNSTDTEAQLPLSMP